MVSFAQIACLPPLLMLSHFEVNFPSVMTQGSEATFSRPQNYLFIISSVYSPLFWPKSLPSLKSPRREAAALSAGFPESRLGLDPLISEDQ